MTDICLERNKNITDISILGHCNAGRINGYDLCCCAVSMLSFTLMDSLKKLKLKGFDYSYGGGWCHIKFKNRGRNYTKALLVIETVMNGFELLRKKYPENINLQERSIQWKK